MIIEKKQKSSNGLKKAFTLIEVLVAILIFVIILGVIIVNYGHSKRVDELRLVTYDIEDSIRFVQNMALTGQKIQDTIPKNGYGVIFNNETDSYSIYGDKGDYDPNIPEYIDGFDTGDYLYSNTALQDFNSKLRISNISCNVESGGSYSWVNYPSLDINFSSPRGMMSIINSTSEISECLIEIINENIPGKWQISITPNSSRIWTEFSNP